jgi:adenine-specific DNA-methyltransferase
VSKNKYETYTREQLLAEVEKLSKRKKYGLVWEEEKTKEKFEKEAEGKLPVLVEDKKREIKTNPDKPVNILIEGDNYHALSVLNYTHPKSIDVIYIDPPYNTGNKDFIYFDTFSTKPKEIDKEDTYRHSKWVSFMSKRLKLAKNLLKSSGVIFISIDDNEIAQLKLLCDEIFIENNFVATIVRRRRKSQANLSRNISPVHEYLICYCKNLSFLKLNKLKYSESFIKKTFSNPDNDPRGLYQTGPLARPDNSSNKEYVLQMPNGRKIKAKWSCSQETFNVYVKENRLVIPRDGQGMPRIKNFLNELDGTLANTWWEDISGNEEGAKEIEEIFGSVSAFTYPKPQAFIKRILELSTNKNSKILDFMAGSGTTGHSVLELNQEDGGTRQFILCTNNENNICTDVCYPRVKKAIYGYKNTSGEKIKALGSNLKYYKTDFVGSEASHRNKKQLTDKSIEMLCVKENTFDEVLNKKDIFIFKNPEKYTAMLFNEQKIDEFKKEISKLKLPVSVYVFSLEGDDYHEEFEELNNDITICSIPEAILKVYRRIYGKAQLKLKM